MKTNHDHDWVFGKGFKVCDGCAKVQITYKKNSAVEPTFLVVA